MGEIRSPYAPNITSAKALRFSPLPEPYSSFPINKNGNGGHHTCPSNAQRTALNVTIRKRTVSHKLLTQSPIAVLPPRLLDLPLMPILGNTSIPTVHPTLARLHLKHTRGVRYQRQILAAASARDAHRAICLVIMIMMCLGRMGLANEAVLATCRPSFPETGEGEPGGLVAFVEVGEPGHGFDKVFCGFHFGHLW